MKQNRDIVLRIGDLHIPYQDQRAVNVAIKFAEFLQPKIIVLDELIDMYSVSKYSKDPQRKNELQYDLNQTKKFLSTIRNACPTSKMVMVKSNHDERLKKFLRSKAEELECLTCLKFEELLALKKFDITYKDVFMFRGVLFKHGSLIRNNSSYTAKAEFVKEGTSGVSGHTHRLGVYFKTLRGGKYVWIEGGCLCDTKNVEYVDGTADWQSGLAVVVFKKGSSRFYPTVVPIINYEIYWGRRTFR